MTIESYTEKRRQEVVDLVKEFYNESLIEYGQRLSLDALQLTVDKYQQHSFLLIVNNKCVGLLAGVEVHPPYSNDRMYQELVWFVSKPYRSKGVFLLKQAIKVLKQEGFTSLIMAVMYNSQTDKIMRFYKRLGFQPFETHFITKL